MTIGPQRPILHVSNPSIVLPFVRSWKMSLFIVLHNTRLLEPRWTNKKSSHFREKNIKSDFVHLIYLPARRMSPKIWGPKMIFIVSTYHSICPRPGVLCLHKCIYIYMFVYCHSICIESRNNCYKKTIFCCCCCCCFCLSQGTVTTVPVLLVFNWGLFCRTGTSIIVNWASLLLRSVWDWIAPDTFVWGQIVNRDAFAINRISAI